MTNPRTRIVDSRSLPAPPQPAGTVVTLGDARAEPVGVAVSLEVTVSDAAERSAAKLIGKPHGNMRCVGLYLPRNADSELRHHAAATGVTLGEALMQAVGEFRSPLDQRRAGGRRHRRQHVPDGSTVFVLLTIDEAQALRRLATTRTTSVSAICTEAILAKR
jgi:hypothetical protein